MGGGTLSEIGHVCSRNTGRPTPALEGLAAGRGATGKQTSLAVLRARPMSAGLRRLPRALLAAVRSSRPPGASGRIAVHATDSTRMLAPDCLWLQWGICICGVVLWAVISEQGLKDPATWNAAEAGYYLTLTDRYYKLMVCASRVGGSRPTAENSHVL